jgi:hypothetical protein
MLLVLRCKLQMPSLQRQLAWRPHQGTTGNQRLSSTKDCMKLQDEITSVGKWLLAGASYTGAVVGIWALPWDVALKGAVVSILILIVILGLLVAQQMRLKRKVAEAGSETQSLREEVSELKYTIDLTDGMVGLFYSLSQPPDADHEHHFFEIEQEYRIDGDDASYSFSFHGKRVVDGQSAALRLKISGDAPVDAATLVPEARDSSTDQPLQVVFTRDDPYLKVIDIAFDRPIEKGESFKLNLTLRWAGTFPRARRSDYLFSPWGIYCQEGIDRFIGRLSADVQVRNATLEEIENGRRSRSRIQPKTVDRRGRCQVSWIVENPTALYLLRFEKVIPA